MRTVVPGDFSAKGGTCALVGDFMRGVRRVPVGYPVPLVTSWRELKNLVYAHVERS